MTDIADCVTFVGENKPTLLLPVKLLLYFIMFFYVPVKSANDSSESSHTREW